MAVRYYDDALIFKLDKWLPANSGLHVLRPDETKELFKVTADDRKDKPFQLPMITLYRNPDIQILSTIKQYKSFAGLKLLGDADKTVQFNVIPIKVQYQLDIYTKKFEDADEYLRNFLFKLINNPQIIITIPYNGYEIQHTANIRVLDTVSDTSNVGERLYSGEFTKWTIQLEIQDAFLFSVPYKQNWKFIEVDLEVNDKLKDPEYSEISQVYP